MRLASKTVKRLKRQRRWTPDKTREKMNVSDAAYQRCVSEYSTGRFKLRAGEIKVEWQLEKKDVRRVCNRRKGTEYQAPRAIMMIHRPTGIMMQAYLYSEGKTKSELSRLRQDTVKRYLPYLENLVNRHLKGAMGRQFGPIPKGEYEDASLGTS